MDESETKALDKSFFTDALYRSIQSIPDGYRDMSEEEARKLAKPNMLLYELKQSWWTEYIHAQETGNKMRVYKIYTGVCHKDHFYNRVIKDPKRMAWLIQPLETYEVKVSAMLQKALERVPEMLGMELTSKKYKKVDGVMESWDETDPKKIMALLEVVKHLDNRVKGSFIQKQININQHQKTTDNVSNESSSDIDKRIKEIEQQLSGDKPKLIDTVEVEVVEG